ncbi:hypothetical protein ACFSLT_23365 [Novosphingobium resinovorum]
MTDNIHTIGEATAAGRLDRILFTRCPVPTASGIAHSLGWLGEEFGRDGLRVEALQDKPRAMRAHHNEHDLPGLFREGGNIPALATKAKGAPTRVIGLTWIDEWQAVLVRPETGPIAPAQLGACAWRCPPGARRAGPASRAACRWRGSRARSASPG